MTTEIIGYTQGSCVPCSGTGLRDADTICPTCGGSGGRVPVYAPDLTVTASPPIVATTQAAPGAETPASTPLADAPQLEAASVAPPPQDASGAALSTEGTATA